MEAWIAKSPAFELLSDANATRALRHLAPPVALPVAPPVAPRKIGAATEGVILGHTELTDFETASHNSQELRWGAPKPTGSRTSRLRSLRTAGSRQACRTSATCGRRRNAERPKHVHEHDVPLRPTRKTSDGAAPYQPGQVLKVHQLIYFSTP